MKTERIASTWKERKSIELNIHPEANLKPQSWSKVFGHLAVLPTYGHLVYLPFPTPHMMLLCIVHLKFQPSYLLISLEWSILSFFLSLVSSDAPKPSDSIASIMSRGPVVSVSNTNRPLLVAKATDACSIPGLLLMLDSIKCTQDEQVMPVIWKKCKQRIIIFFLQLMLTDKNLVYSKSVAGLFLHWFFDVFFKFCFVFLSFFCNAVNVNPSFHSCVWPYKQKVSNSTSLWSHLRYCTFIRWLLLLSAQKDKGRKTHN